MVVPTDWNLCDIGSLADICSGATPSTTNPAFWNGDIVWVTPSDITDQQTKYLTSSERRISCEGLQNCSAVLLPKGTILLCTRATIGEMSIADKEVTTNQGFKNLICNKNISNEFVYYALQMLKDEMIGKSVGTTFLELSKSELSKIKMFVPKNKEEQTTIAEALSDADSLIASLEKLIAKKKAIKQGAMQELLTGKKRLPGFSGEWVEATLGNCMDKIVGGGTPSRADPLFWNGIIPWATVKDFASFDKKRTQEYITKLGLENSATHLIPSGIPITSTRMGLGKIVIYDVDVAINQDLKALFIANTCDTKFIVQWFLHNNRLIESLGTGSTVKGIRLEQLTELPILLPAQEEQTAIASILSDMDAEIEHLEKKLTKYRLIKQGMMQELLTGRIRLLEENKKTKSAPKGQDQHYADAIAISAAATNQAILESKELFG